MRATATLKTDKATWFREMGATATLMRELLVRFPGPRGTSLKIVEKPGKSIMSSLTSKPVIDTCHNPKCPIEASGNLCNNQCRTENVIYEAQCTHCKTDMDNPMDYIYIGETSRTLSVRAEQHMNDYRRCSSRCQTEEGTSFMWDHIQDVHGGGTHTVNVRNDFNFALVERHKDPMSRQLTESVRIREALHKNIHYNYKNEKLPIKSMNRKNEYFMARSRNWD